MISDHVTIVGGGLAGTELALGLGERGMEVTLVDQKPGAFSEAHQSPHFCELVCSNSLRGASIGNAVGLLKHEMRLLGSYVMRAADATRVPAGGALAVDRERFSSMLTGWLRAHPRIRLSEERVDTIPPVRPLVIATGPLTATALASDLEARLGQEHVAYYDAIAPVVLADSIDYEKAFLASRWDKGESDADKAAYLNCPLDRAEYEAFVSALRTAEVVPPRAFEEPKYFEGCLPIEVMAARGERTLAFGPMKPVGITDPRTGRRPHAVLQLRRENLSGTAYNLVGMQTRMRHAEQDRVFRMIPGLKNVVFERFGSVHRNTFINSPLLLDGTLECRALPGVWFAGQITGVEGYVESAASGLVAALLLSDRRAQRAPELPPATTALGSLMRHLVQPGSFQPTNVTFSLFPPLPLLGKKKISREERGRRMAARAFAELRAWCETRHGITIDPASLPHQELADDVG